MENSIAGIAQGMLVNCGLGSQPCQATGKICLIQRGDISFQEKVQNCAGSGGIGAIIYNNEPGIFYGTMESSQSIPAMSISDTDGSYLISKLNDEVEMHVDNQKYGSFSGTSMATPHVVAAAALVWSYHPSCTAANIRNALNMSAEDIMSAGRDIESGYGLIQAKKAKEYLDTNGCEGASNQNPDSGDSTGGGGKKGGGGGGKPKK